MAKKTTGRDGMSSSPKSLSDKGGSSEETLPEAEAEERFNQIVGKLANTPHKPHKAAPSEQPIKPRES